MATYTITITEGLAYSDARTFATVIWPMAVADTLTLTEAVTLEKLTRLTQSQAVTLTETVTPTVLTRLAQPNTLTLTETVTCSLVQLGAPFNQNQPLTLTETVTLTKISSTPGLAQNQTLTLTETVTCTKLGTKSPLSTIEHCYTSVPQTPCTRPGPVP